MKIELIRNATLRWTVGDWTLLVDPFLADRGTLPAFDGGDPNPLVDLPRPPEEIVAGVDAVLVSHLHPDHFDERAAKLLPKDVPLVCQPSDREAIEAQGFTSVVPLDGVISIGPVELERTAGRHGTGKLGAQMGDVMGFVMRSPNAPVAYWVGDSIRCEEVDAAIEGAEPGLIVTHSGGASMGGSDPIILDAQQTIEICRAAPNATVVAVHLESLDHCPVTRTALRAAGEAAGVETGRLRIPANGEILEFSN